MKGRALRRKAVLVRLVLLIFCHFFLSNFFANSSAEASLLSISSAIHRTLGFFSACTQAATVHGFFKGRADKVSSSPPSNNPVVLHPHLEQDNR